MTGEGMTREGMTGHATASAGPASAARQASARRISARRISARRISALWLLAGAILVHAWVREFLPEGGGLEAALLGFAAGALSALPGAWRRPKGLQQAARAGLLLAVVACALLPARDAAASALSLANPLYLHGGLLLVLAVAALASSGTARRMTTLVGVEWMKLRKGRLLRTGLFVAALATLLSALTHTPVENESGWTQAARCTGVGFWTAEILVLVLGATAIAGEVSQGTLKMVLPHAYRRSEWIGAKAIVLVFAAVLFVVVVTAVGVGYTALDPGLGDVTRIAPAGFGEEDEIQVFQTADVMRSYLLEATLASGMSLLASAMLGLLLSCVFGSLVPALSASFLVFAGLKAGEMFLGLSPETLAHLYASHPDDLRELTESFGRALNERWKPELGSRAAYLSVITAASALLLSMRLFKRRDLHG
jgi:ABC-type transport system involved in multi-copper enzyme maturation permease subunit